MIGSKADKTFDWDSGTATVSEDQKTLDTTQRRERQGSGIRMDITWEREREREREIAWEGRHTAYGIYKDQLNSQQDKFDNKCKEEEEGSGYLGSYLTSLLLITGFGC